MELIELLREHEIGMLADVRRFAASRRHPHFFTESLGRSLASPMDSTEAGLSEPWAITATSGPP